MLVHVAYLVVHKKARMPDSDNTHPNLYDIGTHQRQHIGTGNFFDQYAIVAPIWARLDAGIMRGVRDNAFYLLMFLTGRPLLKPRLKVTKVVASCFLKIGKIHRVVHMCQRIKIAKADLYRIPAWIRVIHVCCWLSTQSVVLDNFLLELLYSHRQHHSSKKQSVLVTACFLFRLYDLNRNPHGVNSLSRDLLCPRDGISSTFAHYVVATV